MLCEGSVAARAEVANTVKHPKILFVSSYDYDWDSVPKQLNGFANTIDGNAKVDYVFMDTKSFESSEVEANTFDRIGTNIKNAGQYDVVVLGDDAALDFALEYQQELFYGVPMVFEGINTEEKARNAAEDPLVTGVVESFPMEDTIALARSLSPNATQIVAICDDTESGRGSLEQYYDSKSQFEDLTFKELDCSQLTDDEMSKKIASYGDETILLYLMLSHNKDGGEISSLEATKLITSAAKIPVFKSDEIGLGDGIFGGVVISYEKMGAQAAQMALDILDGVPENEIEVTTTPYQTMVDEKVMERFEISKAQLPSDCVFLNHTPTFWERYRRVLIPAGGIIGCLIGILVLSVYWNRRRKIYFQNMHEKDLMLDNLIKNIPGGIAIYRFGKTVETLYASEGIPAMSGRTMEEYKEWIKGDIFQKTIYEEDVEEVRQTVQAAVEENEKFAVTYRMIRKDESFVWVQLSAVPIRMEETGAVYYAVFSVLPKEAVVYRDVISESLSGIYICDVENYNMLYANKRVLEDMQDANYAGRKCYEYLLHQDHPCKDCPVKDMDSDTFIYRERDIGGRHLNLKSKIFDFHGIRAHIEYVTDDTYRYQEQKKKESNYLAQMKLLSQINEKCLGNHQINVSKNRIRYVYSDGTFTLFNAREINSIDQLLEKAERLIPNQNELQMYQEMFTREHLMECFNQGDTVVSLEHHVRMNGSQIKWCRTSVVMMENPITNEIEGYIHADDIQLEKIRMDLMKKALETNGEILICLDVNNNTHVMFTSYENGEPRFFENSTNEFQRYIQEHCEDEDKEEILEKISQKKVLKELEKKEVYSVSFPITVKGEKQYRQTSFSYFDKELNLVALMITDITEIYQEHKEQAMKIKQALAEAEKANAAKTEFLARMSHDMRTPMNGILGLSYLMEDQTDIGEMKKNIQQLRESGMYLLQLINDVLDVNKIETRTFKLHPDACDEKKLFESITEVITSQVQEKKIAFHFKHENMVWKRVRVDEQRVKEIFVNLLSNAVKFTPEGGKIDFEMRCIKENKKSVLNQFVIRDNGIGMSKEFMKKMFRPFEQENQSKEGLEGTGLGLPIVKNLVELMGGTIQVTSEQNSGTEIVLELEFPVVDQEEKELIQNLDPEKIELPKGLRVLLCEDHPLNAIIAQKLLEKQEAIVTWKENGKLGVEAFKSSENGYFDVVLMDIRMPVMDGLEAAKEIRSLDRPDAKIVPIIAMTANAYDEDVKKSLEAGMNEHLAKPINPNTLYAAIERYL